MFRSQRRHGRAGCVGVELLEPRVALRASALMMPIADVYDEGLRWGGAELHATSEAFTPDPDPTLDFAHNRLGLTGYGQTVAIIDTGVAYDHPALGGGLGTSHRVVGGWDFTEEHDADPYDDGPAGFHGTHVAGIVGSSDATHTGVAPEVDLVALRVFNDLGVSSFEWVEDALQWVHAHRDAFEFPITTVNLSLGTDWNDTEIPSWSKLEDELAQLRVDGIFVVASAGNGFLQSQTAGLTYPAASPHLTAVASVGSHGALSSFSQRAGGTLAAPGESITSSVPDYLFDFNGITDDFATASGTSMSAPYAAGAGVLVRQAMIAAGRENPQPYEIESHLRETSDAIWDPVTGTALARINLQRALEALVTPVLSTHEQQTLDLGIVRHAGWQLSGQHTYAVQASVTGVLSLQWQPDVDLWLHAEAGDRGHGSPIRHPTGRVDLEVTAGQIVRFRLDSESEVNLHASQLVQPTEQGWSVLGSAEVDQLRLSGTSDPHFVVHGRKYALSFGQRIDLHGWEAEDTVRVTASDRSDDVRLSRNHLTVEQAGDRYDVTGFSHLILDGHAGNDRLYVQSTGGSQFVMQANRLDWTTDEIHVVAEAFERMEVTTAASDDEVTFYDRPTKDQFFRQEAHVWMRGSGYLNVARGFAKVTAHARHGGQDQAHLVGTNAKDTFWGTPSQATLVTPRQTTRAHGFPKVFAHGGQEDRAELRDGLGDDTLLAGANHVSLQGDGYLMRLSGFGSTNTIASFGYDVATFHDSAAIDQFGVRGGSVWMENSRMVNRASAFDRVFAESRRGGDDLLEVFDSRNSTAMHTDAMLRDIAGKPMEWTATGFARSVDYVSRDAVESRATSRKLSQSELRPVRDHTRRDETDESSQAEQSPPTTRRARSGLRLRRRL